MNQDDDLARLFARYCPPAAVGPERVERVVSSVLCRLPSTRRGPATRWVLALATAAAVLGMVVGTQVAAPAPRAELAALLGWSALPAGL